jgi:maltodextrin utilization protein YvdJ
MFLCVMDRDKQQYHMFPLSLGNASRLAYECSGILNTALGAVSDKFATQEIVAQLIDQWGRR